MATKISDLVKKLQSIQEEFGDSEIVFDANYSDGTYVPYNFNDIFVAAVKRVKCRYSGEDEPVHVQRVSTKCDMPKGMKEVVVVMYCEPESDGGCD